MNKKTAHLLFAGLYALLSSTATALVIDSPTTSWNPILYVGSEPDPNNDQQTGGTEGDIVGNTTDPAFYTQFDDAGTSSTTDGTLAFRVRLQRVKNETTPHFGDKFFIGVDADVDGDLDVFIGVNNSDSGNADYISLWNAGTDLNISPNTTSIESPPLLSFAEAIGVNYHYAAVNTILDPTATTLDVDGGGDNDWFMSFSFDFNTLVSHLGTNNIAIDENSPLRYVIATSRQDNALNMDLGGIDDKDKTLDLDQTWEQLGATSVTMTATGEVVPEPHVIGLLAAGYAAIWTARRVKRWREPNELES